jgi:hypothetical protein
VITIGSERFQFAMPVRGSWRFAQGYAARAGWGHAGLHALRRVRADHAHAPSQERRDRGAPRALRGVVGPSVVCAVPGSGRYRVLLAAVPGSGRYRAAASARATNRSTA